MDRYKKLHRPVVELVQAIQDSIPEGAALGEKIELTQLEGYIDVATTLRPRALVLNDGQRKFILIIEEVK